MKQLFGIVILLASIAAAGSIREGSLRATSDGGNVTVQWGSADESAVKEFVVERRNGTAGEFSGISVVAKKGNNSNYEYVDRSAFKTSGSIYQYRIKTVLQNGTAQYSTVITISHNVSSVKRTWGSLKAMFR